MSTGIVDRFVNKGVVFRKDTNYQRLLGKCVCQQFFQMSRMTVNPIVANGPIYDGDSISVNNNNEMVPWTLETYIQVLGMLQKPN